MIRQYFSDPTYAITFIRTGIEDGYTEITTELKSEEFVIDSGNNTTYIDMNTLPIQNSIGWRG